MLHELEGEVDVVRHTFAAAVSTGDLGFYRNKRSRRIYAVSKHWDVHRSELFLTAVKGSRRTLERGELEDKYERVESEQAREWWEVEYAKTPAVEPRRFHILSGAIFPIYDKVMGSSGIRTLKIARAVLADEQAGSAGGQALIGLNLSASDVPKVKQRLGIGTPLGEASPEEILSLLIGGALIELDNGWQLTSARIAGDDVVELVLNGVPGNREELRRYGLLEEIINYKRRWFVLSDEAATTLPNLLSQRKPIRDLTAEEVPALVEQN